MNPPDSGGERSFAEPWEAQAFALAVALHQRGLFSWKEWAEALGGEIAKGGPYYECWLAALELLVERKRVMTAAERLERIAAWDRAAHATPHGQPIELSRAWQVPERLPEANRPAPDASR